MDYVKFAYGLVWNDEYVLLPWMNNNGQRFDVTARVPVGATRAQLKEMIEVLLEDRFALKFHHEEREQLIYRLVLAKGGPKLKPASPAHAQEVGGTPAVPTGPDRVDKEGFPVIPDHSGLKMVLVSGGARIRAYRQTMERISGMLSGQTGRRVIDATGLTGKYDFMLAFLTSASAGLPAEVRTEGAIDKDLPGVTIFGAVEKQLGLKLEPAKQVGNVFVVDSMRKTPTSN